MGNNHKRSCHGRKHPHTSANQAPRRQPQESQKSVLNLRPRSDRKGFGPEGTGFGPEGTEIRSRRYRRLPKIGIIINNFKYLARHIFLPNLSIIIFNLSAGARKAFERGPCRFVSDPKTKDQNAGASRFHEGKANAFEKAKAKAATAFGLSGAAPQPPKTGIRAIGKRKGVQEALGCLKNAPKGSG